MADRPRLFIEEHFPTAEFGIESVRERAVAMDLPPLFALHVWWARRPLVASAGAILGSLLPAWTPDLAETFEKHPELSTADAYRTWLLHLCGIRGDPVIADELMRAAKASGTRIPNQYTYKQAYKNRPPPQQVALLHEVLEHTWGRLPSVSDPTAGGGSIPFEAIRYGLSTHANDLNPIATSVLRAGVELPAKFGTGLVADLEHWGGVLIGRLKERLAPFFPSGENEKTATFIFARTVACPRTGKPVPLVRDWSLRRVDKPVAVRLVTLRNGVELDEPEFEIVEGSDIDFDPKKGTASRGKAISPWDSLAIDGDYIRAEAQAGRMGEVLYAVAIRTGKVRGFRTPTKTDLDALVLAENELARMLPGWEAEGLLPDELIPEGNKTREPHNYGMTRWRDMFSPRQLLVHGCFVEEYRRLIDDVRTGIPDQDRADAVLALLALIQGKAINYNSRLSVWHVSRQVMANTFSSHTLAFKSTYAEFEGAHDLWNWCLRRGIVRAYKGLTGLLRTEDAGLLLEDSSVGEVKVSRGTAGHMPMIPDGSHTLVCIDPPYYDNVMYAELSDFFYVWEKRTLGRLWPEFFVDELTNKKDEAVANPARFADAGKRKKALADHDYESKMAAIFSECRRILSDDGVLTVMFTHKRADAWDGLGAALLRAGFTIEASWPVRTESEQSMHQARQNSAKSTIFMVCRKRDEASSAGGRVYLDDIEADIRHAAREALSRSTTAGLSGVDLLLSTYGPALSVLSAHWPVYSSEASDDGKARLLRPEEALDIARGEVTHLQKARLVGRDTEFDPVTDFVVVAWDTFKARAFPFDDARRLALAISGMDMSELERDKVFTAKSGTVTMLEPGQRLRRSGDEGLSGVNRDRSSFPAIIDAVHTALYLVDQDGPAVAKRWLDERNLTGDQSFVDCLQALVGAMPRSKTKGEWNVAEAGLLDRLLAAYFPAVTVPDDPEVIDEQKLFGDDG
jgi:adenine-specific DNA methylase